MATIDLSIVVNSGTKEINVEPDVCSASPGEDMTWQAAQGITRWMVVLEGKKPLSNSGHKGQSPFTGNRRIFEGQGSTPQGGTLKGGQHLNNGDEFEYLVLCWDANGSYHMDPDIVIEDIVARKRNP